MRWPLVPRSKFNEQVARAERLKVARALVWADHLARCDCHDSWDQCEHSASGHHKGTIAEDAHGRQIYECGCCRWC